MIRPCSLSSSAQAELDEACPERLQGSRRALFAKFRLGFVKLSLSGWASEEK